MTQEIRMPDLGTATSSVVLVKWLRNEGDKVKRGESLCEVETDKATTELESVAEGTVLKWLAAAGDKVEAGRVIAIIGEPGERLPAVPGRLAQPGGQEASGSVPERPAAGEARIAPIVRNLARKLGVDTSVLRGTGRDGQITREDVLAVAGPKRTEPEEGSTLSKNQLGVARTLAASWKEIVPITLFCKLKMCRAVALREASQSQSKKLSFDSLFVKCLAAVMAKVPKLNGYFDDGRFVASETAAIGVAISVGDDLFLPVIRNAQKKSADELDAELRALAAKASGGRLVLEDMEGASMTISNLGMFPVEAFTAIVPPKQCGILSVGAVEEVIAFGSTGKLKAEKVCTVALTVDHRLVNGRLGAQVLQQLKQEVEKL